MRIVFLLESAAQIWGGVKVVLDDANSLADRGHDVVVVARSQPPEWMSLRCGFRTVTAFDRDSIPEADVVVGTFWSTVPAATASRRGTPVHLCQGYEGDSPEWAAWRADIDGVYASDQTHKITVSPHLTDLIAARFGKEATCVGHGIDLHQFTAGSPREPGSSIRVGLVGPFGMQGKGIATGLEACTLAHAAGLDLVVVRVTNTPPHPNEQRAQVPIEWHEAVPPAKMGDVYRGLDVMLGTSIGPEGFFLPAIEAMACGVPCVLTDIHCHRGYGSGEPPYALFVEPGNVRELAEALVVVARHPETRRSLIQGGLQVARRYDRERHVDALETELARIAAHGDSRPSSETGDADLREVTTDICRSLLELAAAHRTAERYAESTSHVEAAACLRPDDPELACELGHARYLAGDANGALAAYQRALELGADEIAVHRCRGLVQFGSGNNGEAAHSFAAAIRAGERTATAFNDLGVALHASGDVAGAATAFRDALALEPDHPDATANVRDLQQHAGAP
jgi:Flp pilus assembly protein TadD